MKNRQDYEALRRYLLGEMAEGEADRLEEQMLADDELFELACAVEEEILDACARGKLRRAECDGLAARLGKSPGGRDRVTLARGLAEVARREKEEKVGRTRFASLAAGLVAAVLCINMAIPNRQYVPMSQLRGGGEVPQVTTVLGRRTELHVDLGFAAPERAFRAAVTTAAGQPVWSQNGLRPAADGTLVLSLPPFRLAQGMYRLTVIPEGGGGEKEKPWERRFKVVR
jgi:hypothetical protein